MDAYGQSKLAKHYVFEFRHRQEGVRGLSIPVGVSELCSKGAIMEMLGVIGLSLDGTVPSTVWEFLRN